MRHLRPFAALLTIAAVTVACSGSSPGANSGGDQSQGSEQSQGGEASQPAASTGGGGGGGGGANGSVTYEITGDYEASGELPFLAGGISNWDPTAEGWVANFASTSGESAVILINTQSAEGTLGQIFTFGDGIAVVTATSDSGAGMGCTFTLSQNDASGTEGSVECDTAFMQKNDGTGGLGHVQISAQWEGHP